MTSDTLLLVDGGGVRPFDGDLDDYPAWLAGRDPAARQVGDEDLAREGGDRKQQRRQSAETRKALQPLRKREQQLEQRLAALNTRRAALEQTLATSELYEPEGKSRLLALLAEQRQLSADLEETEDAWLEVSESIEQFFSRDDGHGAFS